MTGYPDGTYQPAWAVTRDQMAVYLARALAGGDALVPTGPETASFPDVPAGQWAYRYVEYARSRGVVQGYPEGTYQPAAVVDRAQMAVYVSRAVAGSDGAVPAPAGGPSFADVSADFWAYRYVEYAKGRGIVQGYPDGLYHPEAAVTRDQMAVYVARAFGLD